MQTLSEYKGKTILTGAQYDELVAEYERTKSANALRILQNCVIKCEPKRKTKKDAVL